MTIRFRITVWFIFIILFANGVLFFFNVRHIENVLLDEVQTRVRLDLNSARRIYYGRIQSIERFLSTSSVQEMLFSSLSNEAELTENLESLLLEGNFEMLTFLSPDGAVLYRVHNPAQKGDRMTDNPLIYEAIQKKRAVSGTLIVSPETLQREGERFSSRSQFTVQYTPGQRPNSAMEERHGMLIGAAVPLLQDATPEEMVGVLYGSILLNRSFDFVDAIRDEVYQNQKYEGRDIGIATLFQNDLRISTNVLNEDGTRAIGTRLSEEVYDEVFNKGRIWSKRAFVVNDWYLTAYEPIKNPDGTIIGALFVGILEAPFKRQSNMIIIGFLMVIILTTIATLLVLGFSTNYILRPISQIIAMANKVIHGDLTARIKSHPPGEMGRLCTVINQMADAVYQREEKLKHTTRQQIGQSEKLASIGRLAAGIAHEINNPLTGVLTFAHLLRDKPHMTEEDQEDLTVIVRETTRVREIVRGMLDFARESVSEKKPLVLNEVVEQTMLLLHNQKEFRQIQIVQNLDPALPPVLGDKNQLQQVLLNLSLNACEAMPHGGMLTITTHTNANGVLLTVQDTGGGIAAKDIEKIFDPFFTTKPVGKGTGLGLSVSYGIVQSHNGTITVCSEEKEGTTFTVFLPIYSMQPSPSENGEDQ